VNESRAKKQKNGGREGEILVVEVWMGHSGMGLWIRLYILRGRGVDAHKAITRVSE
jgi:hypothetical protein